MTPKVFHQPLADYIKDATISATLERELERSYWAGPSLKRLPPTAVDPLFLMRLSPGPTAGDGCEGSMTVMIGGFPAAQLGDQSMHGTPDLTRTWLPEGDHRRLTTPRRVEPAQLDLFSCARCGAAP